MQPILIDGEWIPPEVADSFRAENPANGHPLGGIYPISAWSDCERALNAAAGAVDAVERAGGAAIAGFLSDYAQRIEDDLPSLCGVAESETGLPQRPRLMELEGPRTIRQLRLAAEAAATESWRAPIRDPEANIHSCLGPIGPVVAFGPNNFPMAYNPVAGGDFASAIAAGNPVIAKAHPAHPETSRRLAEHALAALRESPLPAATVQMLYGCSNDDGLRLVSDPRVGAVGFTGSRRAGVALKATADAVGTPIYLEMSGVNPVFFLPAVVAEKPVDLAAELVGSCLLASGQFCTCPNLFVVRRGPEADTLIAAVGEQMRAREPGVLLTIGVRDGMAESIRRLVACGAEVLTGGGAVPGPGYRFQPTLLRVDGQRFLDDPESLQTEAFGPATLAVLADSDEQMLRIAERIEGSLTGSVYSQVEGADDGLAHQLMSRLRRRVGRLLNDKMPTGVAVSPAMNHGGPYPATGHPGFTAVGLPTAIRRFAKLDCYDNVREPRLPKVLRDA